MSSMPARVAAADLNDLKPSIGRTVRLTARWSCSTMLLRYLTWRISMPGWCSALQLSIAAVLAPRGVVNLHAALFHARGLPVLRAAEV